MSAGISKLRRVLLAYSLHNPAVGYCQGFNMIAAIALLFLDEEDAFWCLLYIVELLMPGSYYTRHMSGAMVDQVHITHANINSFINIKYFRRFSRNCCVRSFLSLQYILVSYFHNFCLYIHYPLLYAESHGVDISLFSLNWFLCIFVGSAPVNTYLHIWDSFLFEGSKVAFNFVNRTLMITHHRCYSAMLLHCFLI